MSTRPSRGRYDDGPDRTAPNAVNDEAPAEQPGAGVNVEVAPSTWGAAVAARVRAVRGVRGLSARALAQACADIGAPHINQALIANLETGRRRITVDELGVLAAALNVPPSELLTPLQGPVAVTVTVVVDSPTAVRGWVLGAHPLPGADAEAWQDYLTDHVSVFFAPPARTLALLQESHLRLAEQHRRLVEADWTRVQRWLARAVDQFTRPTPPRRHPPAPAPRGAAETAGGALQDAAAPPTPSPSPGG